MSSLPWLVVHGTLVWQATFVATIIGAIALAHKRPRRAAWREAAAARARLGAPLAGPADLRDGTRVVLTGRLEIEDASRALEDGMAAEGMSLVAGDVRVELEGPVEILAGSREVRRGNGVVSRSLATGDDVRVSGVLQREAAPEGKDYRAPAVQWSLVCRGEAERLSFAFEGTPRVSGPAPSSYASSIARGAAGLLMLLAITGEIAYQAESSALGGLEEKPPALDSARRTMTIAAMTPFRRDSALAKMAPAEAPTQAIALNELAGDCDAASAAALAHSRLAEARALADRCKRPDLAARALYLMGDFEGASAALTQVGGDAPRPRSADAYDELRQPVFRAQVHLLAGRFALAADEVRRLREVHMPRFRPSPDYRPASTAEPVGVPPRPSPQEPCIVEAIAARGGDREAISRLRQTEESPSNVCAALLADLLAGPERLAWIREHEPTPDDALAPWFELLAAEVDPGSGREPLSPQEIGAFINLPLPFLWRTLPGVSRSLADTLARAAPPYGDPRRRALSHAAARTAGFAAIAGSHEEARRYARVAIDNADPQALAVVRTLAAAVEIFAGDLARGSELLALDGEPRRDENTRISAWNELHETVHDLHDIGSHKPSRWRRIRTELTGSGVTPVEFLGRDDTLRGLVVRLEARSPIAGRDELIAWLRAGPPAHAHDGPAQQLLHWTTLSEIAFALGEDALGHELRQRARPFAAALLRRDIAVPLAVLEQL